MYFRDFYIVLLKTFKVTESCLGPSMDSKQSFFKRESEMKVFMTHFITLNLLFIQVGKKTIRQESPSLISLTNPCTDGVKM